MWFEAEVADLMPQGVTCPKCNGSSIVKETDILDVWFDSGVSWAAVCEQRKGLDYPCQLYLEGSDQHRGWFHSALLTSVGTRGRAPYGNVLTHGFVVDGQGKKMSKSLGNVIQPQEIIDKYGADILRLWVSAEDYRDDIRISPEILERLSEAYRRIRNTCRFLLGNLADFNPQEHMIEPSEMRQLDRFASGEAQQDHTEGPDCVRGFRVPRSVSHVVQLLHRGLVLSLSGYSQGPALCGENRRRDAKIRSDRSVPHSLSAG